MKAKVEKNIAIVLGGIAGVVFLAIYGILPVSGIFPANAKADSYVAPAGINLAAPSLIPTTAAITTSKATYGGLVAELLAYDLNPEYPTVTICTDLPTVADWLPRFSMTYKGATIEMLDWMLLDPDNTAYMKDNRCYLVTLSPVEFTSGKLKVSLNYFEMSIPERLPDELIAKANKNLKDKGLDIDFEMKNVDHGQTIVIKKKPSTYTDDQAYQAIQRAIEESAEKVYGPWAFVIDLP